ncbi:tripartite tricarboxylate transporter [candidate division KSB3 bacterium]|uniref:Tripartite tricarboxylate transporter n=1 Tax=candidate division KSB3 bacterium TaxID=2044937 RepID=A0A2G6KJA7_9BACT|nr:MAG: tripartite tricarboxylate transporter [candidate division KSB3 bacterium]
MEGGTPSFFQISIDFNESHTFFPMIILWILLILLAIITIVYGIPFFRDIRSGKRNPSFFVEQFDKLRLFGTLILAIVYFILMDAVGMLFPNMGFGFLFVSIPFMFVLSLLYAHNIDRKKLLVIGINSILAPCIAWYILGNLFNISLP